MAAARRQHPTSSQVFKLLRAYESRNVTFLERDGSWPIVWEHAQGVHVWDAEGKKYLDLTAAFGVAAAGHAHPRIVQAGQRQMATLLHAMGDVHPHARKAQLARELSRVTFERWSRSDSKSPKFTAKTIFCNSGFEAVEAALKTALLATGKRGVIAFTGAYHGLGYGALNATHREHFRSPFRSQLGEFAHFISFPTRESSPAWGGDRTEHAIRRLFRQQSIGAVLVEPIQARGGINIPPPPFLPLLRRLCDTHGALLLLDEIYTGFGRTGAWFACEHSRTIPDLICLGKALTGGFPLSACVGKAEVMDAAWPASGGEAIHTSTFLGHPVGCAMALAQIETLRRPYRGKRDLVSYSRGLGAELLGMLATLQAPSGVRFLLRGLGLMIGLEVRSAHNAPATAYVLRVIKTMLHRGFILLPEGEHSNVISFTPPLTVTKRQLERTVAVLQQAMEECAGP